MRLGTWWGNLAARDRRVIAIGLAILIATGAWLGFESLFTARASLRAQVAKAEADAAWMKQASASLVQLRQAGVVATGDRAGRSLLALADASARDSGLGAALKRVEPVNEGRVNVWFEGAPFDVMATWLESLAQRYGVSVDELSVDRVEGPGQGLVNARVTLLDTPR